MASQTDAPAQQLLLWETIQVANGDGSFTVRPHRIAIAPEIGAKKAARILGYHIETIYRLCELGEESGGIRAYRLPSERGNAKWRIYWDSVIGYKERRRSAVRNPG